MRKLDFYRQAREDGGIRSGLEIDEATYFERFESGSEENDPTLKWWVDVRCRGRGLPRKPEEAKQWFLDKGALIKSGLLRLADRLEAGMDKDIYPLFSAVSGFPKGTKVTIACSTTRRMTARQIGDVLKDVAAHWDERLKQMPAVTELPV